MKLKNTCKNTKVASTQEYKICNIGHAKKQENVIPNEKQC